MKKTILLLSVLTMCSCSYLDIVPDNISTLEMAFNNRNNANKHLNTCYNYFPMTYDMPNNSGMFGADDVSPYLPSSSSHWNFTSAWSYTRGGQNTTEPIFNYWSGYSTYSKFRGIHECNIFLANVGRVPDISHDERERWIAEALTIKAYYLYWLMLHYGPIPLLKDNQSISADYEDMTLYREKVDDVVAYIVELLDQVIAMDPGLPPVITSTTLESGRITLSGAMSIKAKVLLLAASPLYNGNTDYADFLDPRDNLPFFNQEKSQEKWQAAATAALEAITEAEKYHELFKFEEVVNFPLNDDTRQHMTLREITTSRFNKEQILAVGRADPEAQRLTQVRLTTYQISNNNYWSKCQYAPTLNVIEEYYSKNGVPLEEDTAVNMADAYDLVQTPADADPVYYIPNYPTIKLHLDREPRFYAHIGFDGGKWFTTEVATIEESYGIYAKKGGTAGPSQQYTSGTGYFCKKICSYRNINSAQGVITYETPNLHIRLADLYLMYSEALNETMEAPDEEVYKYIQKVRHRAGLDVGSTLQQTWATHSKTPNKPLSQEGMREIIHRERLIELQFEGWRLHDIRRWKKSNIYFDKVIRGLSIDQSVAEKFYTVRTIYKRNYDRREYLFPIAEGVLLRNNKLVQNPLY